MTLTIVSPGCLGRYLASAKQAANSGPVIVIDRGQPNDALLKAEAVDRGRRRSWLPWRRPLRQVTSQPHPWLGLDRVGYTPGARRSLTWLENSGRLCKDSQEPTAHHEGIVFAEGYGS